MSELPRVGLVMGSKSDWPTMRHAASTLRILGVPFETRVISAHRTPDIMEHYARGAATRGLRVIIAGAGGAAHLPGMLASYTNLPVLGVPITGPLELGGMDALLSIAQMPAGCPVGTLAIGQAGAINASLLAARILILSMPQFSAALTKYNEFMRQSVLDVTNAPFADEQPPPPA